MQPYRFKMDGEIAVMAESEEEARQKAKGYMERARTAGIHTVEVDIDDEALFDLRLWLENREFYMRSLPTSDPNVRVKLRKANGMRSFS